MELTKLHFILPHLRHHIMPAGAKHPGHHRVHDELCVAREPDDCHRGDGAHRRPSPRR